MIFSLPSMSPTRSEDRRGDGRAQQIGGQEPARPALRRVQRVFQLGDGRNDQRLQQGEGQRRRAEDGEGECVVGGPVAMQIRSPYGIASFRLG